MNHRIIELLEEVVDLLKSEEQHSKYYYDYDRNKGGSGTETNPYEFTIQDIKYNVQYTDEELNAMCDKAEQDELNLQQSKEQIYKNYRAAIDEYNKLNKKYKDLEESHYELQDLFYKVDGELDELKSHKDNSYSTLQEHYHTMVRELNKCINKNLELAAELDNKQS